MEELQEYTLSELEKYNGEGPDGRILVALNAHVYDVTEHGRQFYGKGMHSLGLNVFYSGIKYTEKYWVRPKVRHCPLQLVCTL